MRGRPIQTHTVTIRSLSVTKYSDRYHVPFSLGVQGLRGEREGGVRGAKEESVEVGCEGGGEGEGEEEGEGDEEEERGEKPWAYPLPFTA